MQMFHFKNKHFMKKSLLTAVVAVGTCFSAMAQTADHFESDALKPTSRNFTTEFGLTGGMLNSDFKLVDGGLLKFRYFLHDDLALRLGMNISHNAETTKYFNSGNTANGTLVESSFGMTLNLGIEKHLPGTRNLSPYVGGDLMIATSKDRVVGTEIDYSNDDFRTGYSFESKGPKSFGFGVRGIIGADFYVMKHVFIGVEAGLGFMYATEGDYEFTVTTPSNTNTTNIKGTKGAFEFSPHMTAGVRLGFVF